MAEAPGPVSYIDGLPCAVGTARAFELLKAWFEEAFPGVTLHVYSGWRSYELQKKIFLERYVLAHEVNGRYVYDTRWWEGRLYYRISGEGTVAQPGTSNHGDGRALDIRDSGDSPGVTRYGNARSAWIRDNAWRAGFDADGYRDFNEPWHIRFTASSPWLALGVSRPDLERILKEIEDRMTPEQDRKLNEVHSALPKINALHEAVVVDGPTPETWSVPHVLSFLRRQRTDQVVNAPTQDGQKWSINHILDWMGRTLVDVLNRVKALENK